MAVGLIWAQSTTGVIGRDGGIPWELPEDLARFRELTLGHTVVMGRRTWDSLPARVRPLPGRRNVVITRNPHLEAPGAQVAATLPTGPDDGEIWVIGGAEIYHLAMPVAVRCEVTEVAADLHLRDEDVLAPALDESWTGTSGPWRDSASGLRYRYHSYHRG